MSDEGLVRVFARCMLGLTDAGIGRVSAHLDERIGMLVNRTAYWQRAWDALRERTRGQRAEVERLFLEASIHSSADARTRSLALAEVLDVLDGRKVDPAQRLKDIATRAAKEGA